MSKKNESRAKGEIKQNERTKFVVWLILARHGHFVDPVNINNLPRPRRVGKNEVPTDLNGLTLGQLLQLQEMKTDYDTFYIPCKVLFGMSKEEVAESLATEVVGLSSWVSREVERISKLFESCHNEPKPQEVRAGIHRLNFGIFGLVDWYARRMGITNHEEVESVPWVRVYKCMQMDAEMEAYSRRLNEVYRQENERRNKR